MHLNPPSFTMFLISVVLAGVGLAAKVTSLPFITPNAVWMLLAAAYLVLLVGCLTRGF